MKMNLTAFAKKIKRDPSYIHRLKKQGVFKDAISFDKKLGKDVIDYEKGLKLYNGERVSQPKIQSNKETSVKINMDFNEAKCMKMSYEALQEQIKYEKEIGKLIESETVEKNAYRTGLILRDRILAVATQVAPLLVGKTSEFEIKNKILELLNTALNMLCDEMLTESEDEEK